jgi:hypothetical protein
MLKHAWQSQLISQRDTYETILRLDKVAKICLITIVTTDGVVATDKELRVIKGMSPRVLITIMPILGISLLPLYTMLVWLDRAVTTANG